MDLDELRTLQVIDDSTRPKGAWSGAPSLAATTVAMTNTSGFPILLGVSGGVVTVCTVDGVAITSIAATGFRIRLRRNSTVALTYSSAPTLQWLYE